MKAIIVGIAFLAAGCANDPFGNLNTLALSDATAASMLAMDSNDPVAQACWDKIVAIASLVQKYKGVKGVFIQVEIARIIQRDNAVPDCRSMLLSGFGFHF